MTVIFLMSIRAAYVPIYHERRGGRRADVALLGQLRAPWILLCPLPAFLSEFSSVPL